MGKCGFVNNVIEVWGWFKMGLVQNVLRLLKVFVYIKCLTSHVIKFAYILVE